MRTVPFARARWLVAVLFSLEIPEKSHAFSVGRRFLLRSPATTTQLDMATWSDSRAVKEYQDFLSSGKQEIELKKDAPSVIVRPTEGSTELAEWLVEIGLGEDVVVSPGQELPESLGQSAEYPIYVTLPPFQIDDFLLSLPDSWKPRGEDFVFFAGGLPYGNIEDVLKRRGYCRESMTQVVISGMRIAPNRRAQDRAVNLGPDSQGEDKLAGECAACGKWAGAVADRLGRSNVRCRTDFYREWRRRMWERSVYDACFHLIGAVRNEPTTIADVAKYYDEEVGDMVWEMSQLLRGWRALTIMYGFEERLFGIAEMHGGDDQCVLSDELYPYIWGNQVFLQSKTFVEYLHYAKIEGGKLPNSDLPPLAEGDFSTRMRKGILRADGKV